VSKAGIGGITTRGDGSAGGGLQVIRVIRGLVQFISRRTSGSKLRAGEERIYKKSLQLIKNCSQD
jgi:hypothetical protein